TSDARSPAMLENGRNALSASAARASEPVRCSMVISGLVVTLAEGAQPEALGALLASAQAQWGEPCGRRRPLVIESKSQPDARTLYQALCDSALVEFVDVTYVAEDA